MFEMFETFKERVNPGQKIQREIAKEPIPTTEEIKDPQIEKIEQQIRIAQFELKGALREQAQAQLELASIQKPFGAPPSEYELSATKHLATATNKISKYTQQISDAKASLELHQKNQLN